MANCFTSRDSSIESIVSSQKKTFRNASSEWIKLKNILISNFNVLNSPKVAQQGYTRSAIKQDEAQVAITSPAQQTLNVTVYWICAKCDRNPSLTLQTLRVWLNWNRIITLRNDNHASHSTTVDPRNIAEHQNIFNSCTKLMASNCLHMRW